MNKIKYRISLDMLEVASQTTIKVKKGDTACSILITLTENGKIYHISEGCYAVFSAKKPDGNYLFNSETCSIVDNTIVYDFTKQTVACEGIAECEVILYKGEEKLTSPRFDILVDSTVYNGEEIISSPEADALDKLIDDASTVIAEANELVAEVETKLENGDFKGKDADMSLISNALKGNKSGEIVSMTDVSPIEHNVGVKVRQGGADYNENLIPFPYKFMTDFDGTFPYVKESKGITITVNEDKSVVLNGTATGQISFELCMVTDLGLDESKTYTFSGNAEGGYYYSTYYLGIAGGQLGSCGTFTNVSNEPWWQYKDDGVSIDITVWSDTVCNNVIFKPKWEEGSKATSFYPPEEIDLTAVSVIKQGKNLIPFPYYSGSRTINGITFVMNDDGTILLNGTATAFTSYYLFFQSVNPNVSLFKDGITYRLSGGSGFVMSYFDENGTEKWVGGSQKFTWKNSYELGMLYMAIQANTTHNNTLVKPLIEVGEIQTEYEPYVKPTTYTPNENGIVEGVTSLYPSVTLMTDMDGVTIDVEYNRDINKAFAELQNAVINMGGVL